MDFDDILADVISKRRQKMIIKGFIVADLIAMAVTGISIVGISVIAAEAAILAALYFKGGVKRGCSGRYRVWMD
jgi:hypothetical protein